MNKLVWLSAPLMFLCSGFAFAACTQPPEAIFQDTTGKISNFSYQQTFPASAIKPMLIGCNPTVRVNSYFNAANGNTDLTGSSPFGVNASTIQINGSTADAATLNDAKNWLANNFKISFNLRDNSKGKPAKSILNLNSNYNILPETGTGTPIYNDANIPFFNGTTGVGIVSADTITENLTVRFTNTVKPSAAIIAALNGATVRIHLGTYHYKYAPNNNPAVSAEVAGSLELYEDLTLNFNFPTCTMSNKTASLATVPTSVLNNNQTANEQNIGINIICSAALPGKSLLATITDRYTPSNVNNDGILKNNPNLENRSNVDIQLRNSTGTPLIIGSQSLFYSIPAGSPVTSYFITLKARYFRSAPTATPGYVQTQATVSLDYK